MNVINIVVGGLIIGMGDSRTTLQIPMDKSDISFLDFDAKIPNS